MNITILGAGAFGLSLNKAFSKSNQSITIWSKFESEVNNIKKEHPQYNITTNIKEALEKAEIIIIAIPIEYIKDTLQEIKPYYHNGFFLIASKGIETTEKKFAYQLLEEIFPNIPYGILSGGTFAKDMIEEKLMGMTLATSYQEIAKTIKQSINNNIKIEISPDIIGTSICGAIKNVFAIASGILDGTNTSDSTKFLFLTEAILETKSIIQKLNGKEETILTYAGIDDIMMTCSSKESRNYTLGKMMGENQSVEDYINNTTIEGLKTTKALYQLLKEKNITSNLITTIYNILYEQKDKKELIDYLKNIQK